jgi:hypothetical protein
MPTMLMDILRCLLDQLLLDDYAECKVMSQPILSLILANGEGALSEVSNHVISKRPAEIRPKMAEGFSKLMHGIHANLMPDNRAAFTDNIEGFRAEVRSWTGGSS